MEIFIFWMVLTIVVAAMGDHRKIGSFWAFFISLFLSPLIGLIVVLSSKRKDTIEFENKLLEKSSTTATSGTNNISGEIERLHDLKEKGAITNEEFIEAKKKLLN